MIPLFKIHTPSNIGQAIQKVFDEGTITEGKYSDQFEKEFGEMIGNPNIALVNSCTSALTLAYRMCDIKPGDKVISTPFTCMATNEPLDTMGAEIIWCDIDPETGNLDPESLKKTIDEYGNNVKAVVGVHWSGNPMKLAQIWEVLFTYPKINFIQDAAHALGSKYCNNFIGFGSSDFTCFSFQAIKHLTTVDGGAISAGKKEIEEIRKLRWFGLDRKYQGSKWTQDITDSGYKFHMNNVNAVIGLEQMKHINKLIDAHKRNGKFYDEHINNSNVKKMKIESWSESSYWIYTLLVEDRDKFQEYMHKNGITTDVVHIRNDKYSVFKRFQRELPNTDYFCSRHINIPVGWWLTEEERQYIVDVVNKYEG